MARPFFKTRYEWPCTPDCPERKPACHGKCERYLKVRAEKDKELEAHIKQSVHDSYYYDTIRRNRCSSRLEKGRIKHDM